MARLLAALALLAGCAAEPEGPQLPPPLKVIAILPFTSQVRDGSPELESISDAFASELARNGDYRILRPARVKEALQTGDTLETAEGALIVARRLEAQAVVAAAVTEYDPYSPPRVGLSVQFLRVTPVPLPEVDIDRMTQSAEWRRGPLPVTPGVAPHGIAAFERIFDARERRVRAAIAEYVRGESPQDAPFSDPHEVMAAQPRYLQFVTNRLAAEIVPLAHAALR